MIGTSVSNSNSIFKQDVYNGQPCLRRSSIATVNPSIATVNGCSGCIGSDNLPMCADLEAAANNKTTANFDPLNWVKANPLLAGGVAVAAYLLLFKK